MALHGRKKRAYVGQTMVVTLEVPFKRTDRAIEQVNYRMGDDAHRDIGFGRLAAGLRLIQRLAVVRHE